MGDGDTIHQSGNFQVGVAKGPVHLSANQSFEQHLGQLVSSIDKADSTDAAKREAKSRLREFLEHPVVAAIVGGLASTLKI